MKVGLHLALRLVPKYNKIAVHFFFLNFSFYNQCCILQFIAFWRPARNLTPFLRGQPGEAWWSPSYHPPWYREWVPACAWRDRVSVHIGKPEKRVHQALSWPAERGAHVGGGPGRVCVKKALERESQGSCTQLSLLLVLVPRLKSR